MSTSKNKKIGIIALSIAALVFAGSLTAYLLSTQESTPTADVSSSQPTENTPSYGTCEIITTQQIRSAEFGDRITGIQEGVRINAAGLNGDSAEGCTFAFATDKATNNTLTTSIYPYAASQESFDKEIAAARWSEVTGSTPAAYFGRATIDDGKTSLFLYRIPTGGSTVLLTLKQDANSLTYTEPDAIDFLGTLGAVVNVATVNSNVNAQSQPTTGDSAGTPPADTPNVEATLTEPN